jgi:hypothetical protein
LQHIVLNEDISPSAVEDENDASAGPSSAPILPSRRVLRAWDDDSNEEDDLPDMQVLHLGSLDQNAFGDVYPMEADPWDFGGSIRESVHRKANAAAKLVLKSEKKEEEPEIVCKTHGKLCTKKLCSDYDKQVKDMRREARAKAYAQDRGNASGARNDRGGRSRGSTQQGMHLFRKSQHFSFSRILLTHLLVCKGSGRGKNGNRRFSLTSL